jgi:ligand-binding sensor domain-containing protein
LKSALRSNSWLSVCVATALLSTSANADITQHPMQFDHATLDDGLSQSAVISILQDSRGLMWFGTENGLNRFDGYTFEHFKRERGNPNALRSDFIYDIADADNGLWLATNGGGFASGQHRRKRRAQA